ncbi:MAG: sulfite oxidase subunit YedZ [Woeseiaceae bacterium]|nr:sulfite oxidase subunit YedZ [Woeseiaceae bacterium]
MFLDFLNVIFNDPFPDFKISTRASCYAQRCCSSVNDKDNPMKKTWVWTLLSVPALVICVRYFIDSISYGQAIHQTGQWSVGILILTLAITPLRKAFGPKPWLLGTLKHRRALGVACFSYASLHTLFYLERKWGADLIIKEGLEWPLATGWLALAIFLALAITSNDVSVRKMKRGWKRLHRAVYAAALLTFVHWWLATFDPANAYVFAAVLLAVQLLRLKKKRTPIPDS